MLQQTYIDRLITTALDEDIHYIDVTTDNLLDDAHTSEAYYLAKDSGVLCGIDIAKRVFELVGGDFTMDIRIHDGEQVKKGDIIATMTGSTKTLLKGERTALNILQHMSGIATATHQCVELVAGTNAQITDTRKTLPGLRPLQKYAVTVGGGKNHRYNLSDGAMLKDNHIDAYGGIAEKDRAHGENRSGSADTGRTGRSPVCRCGHHHAGQHELRGYDQGSAACGRQGAAGSFRQRDRGNHSGHCRNRRGHHLAGSTDPFCQVL